jgi:hypothetical protein
MYQSLNLSQKVVSPKIVENDDLEDDVVFLEDVIEALKNLDVEQAKSYRELDLSFSALGDDDLMDVRAVVKLLPMCHVINLTGLSLWGTKKGLLEIQTLTHLNYVRYVVVCATPLASSFCQEAYDTFDSIDFSKIVFLDTPACLENCNWHTMVRAEQAQKMVVQTHKQFFEECPDIASGLAKELMCLYDLLNS